MGLFLHVIRFGFLLFSTMNEQPPIHRSFAIADNLAEVSAKSQVTVRPSNVLHD